MGLLSQPRGDFLAREPLSFDYGRGSSQVSVNRRCAGESREEDHFHRHFGLPIAPRHNSSSRAYDSTAIRNLCYPPDLYGRQVPRWWKLFEWGRTLGHRGSSGARG